MIEKREKRLYLIEHDELDNILSYSVPLYW